jgi:hypothetical protein
MRRGVFLAAAILLCACATRPYSSDATSDWQSTQVVGKCYELRRDVSFRRDVTTKPLGDAARTVLRYDGFLYVPRDDIPASADAVVLRSGSRFVVERIVAEHLPMVGVVLKPFARLDAASGRELLEASNLFEFTPDSEVMKPVHAYIRLCA